MLGDKQAAFIAEYLLDLNATQAAIRAGYSRKTARFIGHENLTKPHIAAAIAAAQLERSRRTEVTADRVVAELAKLAFSNMLDYMRPNAEGDPVLDFSGLTRDQAAALQEVTVEDFLDARARRPASEAGDEPSDGREVRRVKFKLADKRAALNDLGRHLGIFNDKLELRGTLTLEQLVAASFKPDA